MGKPAAKNGKPLAKNGKPAATGSPCTCCGTCAHTTFNGCTNCPSPSAAATPTFVEMVFAGVVTACIARSTTRTDLNGATVSGTFTATIGVNCTWNYVENPGTSFNERVLSSSIPTGAGACSGTVLFQNLQLNWLVNVVDRSGTKYVTVSMAGAQALYFYGEALLTDCLSTYVLNNTAPTATGFTVPPNGTGGTCTLTFCP